MKKDLTFEQAMDRLDQITALLENGNLPLDEALKLFTEGSRLLRECNLQLDKAQLKIEELFPGEKEADHLD